jgi:predicted ArsR family transcriptional regulator
VPAITSRQRILNYLKKQHPASAAQIGHALNMSPADVRHHLAIMLDDGRIALIGEKRSHGRGRPVNLYGLSEKSLGDNFPLLSNVVLDELLKKLSPARRGAAIQSIAGKLALQFGDDDLNLPMAKRLEIVVDQLNKHFYQARWEAGSQGPRILFAHCPYSAIIKDHPELCQMDEALLGERMVTSARQLAKMGQMPAEPLYCVFHLA